MGGGGMMRFDVRIIGCLIAVFSGTIAHAQVGDLFSDSRFGGGFAGSGETLYQVRAPERATANEIRTFVAKLGPGLYHRLSGCMPPPAWGTGTAADEAAAHLVKIGPPAVPFVMPLIHTEDEATRALVIEILSRIPDERTIPALIEAFHHDQSDRVRVSAAEGLAWNVDPHAAPALVPGLRDPSRQVQIFAVHALARRPQQSAIE